MASDGFLIANHLTALIMLICDAAIIRTELFINYGDLENMKFNMQSHRLFLICGTIIKVIVIF
ncbi:hypothetical protein ACVNP0_04635 [Staphylococcus aureus]